jgi:hypothetical protein
MSYGVDGGGGAILPSVFLACASWIGAWWGTVTTAAPPRAAPSCPPCPGCTACPVCPACPPCAATATCTGGADWAAGGWSPKALLAAGLLGSLVGVASTFGCGWCRSRWRFGLASEGGLASGGGPGGQRALGLGAARQLAPRIADIPDRASTSTEAGSSTPSETGDSVWVPRRRK